MDVHSVASPQRVERCAESLVIMYIRWSVSDHPHTATGVSSKPSTPPPKQSMLSKAHAVHPMLDSTPTREAGLGPIVVVAEKTVSLHTRGQAGMFPAAREGRGQMVSPPWLRFGWDEWPGLPARVDSAPGCVARTWHGAGRRIGCRSRPRAARLDAVGALTVLAVGARGADDQHGAAFAAAGLVSRHGGVRVVVSWGWLLLVVVWEEWMYSSTKVRAWSLVSPGRRFGDEKMGRRCNRLQF